MKRTWSLAPVFQIVQKISENYYPCLYLPIDKVWWLNELWFKRYIETCTLSHLLKVRWNLYTSLASPARMFWSNYMKNFIISQKIIIRSEKSIQHSIYHEYWHFTATSRLLHHPLSLRTFAWSPIKECCNFLWRINLRLNSTSKNNNITLFPIRLF